MAGGYGARGRRSAGICKQSLGCRTDLSPSARWWQVLGDPALDALVAILASPGGEDYTI